MVPDDVAPVNYWTNLPARPIQHALLSIIESLHCLSQSHARVISASLLLRPDRRYAKINVDLDDTAVLSQVELEDFAPVAATKL